MPSAVRIPGTRGRLGCSEVPEGGLGLLGHHLELVSIHAENVGDSLFGPWKVQTTTMTLRDDRLVVTSTSDSERIYSRTSEVFTRSSKANARRSCGGDLAVRSLS